MVTERSVNSQRIRWPFTGLGPPVLSQLHFFPCNTKIFQQVFVTFVYTINEVEINKINGGDKLTF